MSALYGDLLATDGACALLESTCGAGPRSRLSILARHPHTVVVAGPEGVHVDGRGGSGWRRGDPLDVLRDLGRSNRVRLTLMGFLLIATIVPELAS